MNKIVWFFLECLTPKYLYAKKEYDFEPFKNEWFYEKVKRNFCFKKKESKTVWHIEYTNLYSGGDDFGYYLKSEKYLILVLIKFWRYFLFNKRVGLIKRKNGKY